MHCSRSGGEACKDERIARTRQIKERRDVSLLTSLSVLFICHVSQTNTEEMRSIYEGEFVRFVQVYPRVKRTPRKSGAFTKVSSCNSFGNYGKYGWQEISSYDIIF